MIKKPLNFVCGIWCGMCLVINIVNGRDAFVLLISALATAVNFMIAWNGTEGEG